ncbi:MAG: hypothetical protein KGL39_19715 [Patescibacteria group bacterium]|nr:hypothetical protein [Patescibacteria group bacterium]
MTTKRKPKLNEKPLSCFPAEIYKAALIKWGYQSQVGMLFEEMGELLQILNKYDRKKATIEQVQDELADVQIMVEQMAVVYGRERVHRRKLEKLVRLEKLLKVRP